MSSPTVLVVDDDPAIVELVEMALEDMGYRVLTAVNGAALAVAQDQRPGVILLDVNMPGMDGVEVSQRLRANPITADIPIVAISAHEHLQATAGLLLVDDRLSKPFLIRDLYDTVARWMPPA